MIREIKFWCLICILGISLMPSCIRQQTPPKFRIAFSQCCDDPWRHVMEKEMYRELAFHPEIEFEITVAENSSKSQIEQIRQLVKKGVDLLIVSPNESEPLTPIIEEVYNNGTPVILIDRKTESERYTAYVGADNFTIGQTAASYIATQLKGNAKVIEIQLGMTMTPARDRSRGFQEASRQLTGIQTVAQIEMTGGLDELKTGFLKTLTAHPEANVIFAHSDFLAENAFKWSSDVQREKDLFFVGIDGIPGVGQGIQAVEDGILDASLLYPTGGAEAIRLSVTILNNLPFDKKIRFKPSLSTLPMHAFCIFR